MPTIKCYIRKNVIKAQYGRSVVIERGNSVIDTEYEAGEVINGHRIVCLVDGKLYKASNQQVAHVGKVIGMSLQAVAEGEMCNIRAFGKITNTGWSLTPNSSYYLTTDGVISDVQPATGFIQLIGFSIDADNLELIIQTPIIR